MSHAHDWQLAQVAQQPPRGRTWHPEGFTTDDEEELVNMVRSYRCACGALRQEVELVAAGIAPLGPVRSES